MSTLLFIPLSSSVSPSFWNKLSELKLNVYKLDESSRHIWGFYTVPNTTKLNCLEVDSTSFNVEFNDVIHYIPFHGQLYNKNGIDEFKECDKTLLLNNEGRNLLDLMKNKSVLKDPSLLNMFILLSFADLKKYHYYYWFAFPVPKNLNIGIISVNPVTEIFSSEEMQTLYECYKNLDYKQRSHFLIFKKQFVIEVHTLEKGIPFVNMDNIEQIYFAFYNISFTSNTLGSQLRNYVAFILHNFGFLQNRKVNFLALNLERSSRTLGFWNSFVYNLKLPEVEDFLFNTWVGWEPNEREKMGPRLANMRMALDPLTIAEDVVDLNLKLMKWNVLPNVNLDIIKKSKFLLLGSGTLGCSVARTLLGWGVRNITFVDNATVSFSNPVRQSLFTYDDSVNMKPKAIAAAENLKQIFPGVHSNGIQLSIRMPGHTVGESMIAQANTDVSELTELIKNHDVIFVLMDSRESRWLPTLLGSYYKKIVINAALGFDSYLVMRHGVMVEDSKDIPLCDSSEGFRCINGYELGCYFCNDVTAPGNSLKGRTLDQQCTVTRPGVSHIAGALAVELSISILQHGKGIGAPAFYGNSEFRAFENMELGGSALGVVPHSIRGFLHSFEQIIPATEKYVNCVACSKTILSEYKEHGMDFLMKVFNNSKHLEDVALLTALFEETKLLDVLNISDDDDF